MVVQSMCGGGTERELAVDIVPGQGIMSASSANNTWATRTRQEIDYVALGVYGELLCVAGI